MEDPSDNEQSPEVEHENVGHDAKAPPPIEPILDALRVLMTDAGLCAKAELAKEQATKESRSRGEP